MGTEKIRKAFYIEEELLGQVDALLPQADVRSRNEFVNRALRFYIGYLTSEKIENYMLTTISSVMHATVKDSENRMARAMYIRICMSTVSEKYYDTASGGKGKMKKAEKITIKVLKVVERIARNEVEKTVLGRTAECSAIYHQPKRPKKREN